MADLYDNDDDGVIASLPDLQLELSHSADLLILQQTDTSGNASRMLVHKWQVRLIAEEFGLLPATQPVPRREVADILARRLRALHERIDTLAKYLNEVSDDDFAKQQSLATCEIGDEYLADLPELLGHPFLRTAPALGVPAVHAAPPTPPTAASDKQRRLV